MDDYDERAITAWQIKELLSKYGDPEKIVPVIAASLSLWCNMKGEDLEAVVALLMETVSDANGLEVEEGE